MGAVPTRVSHPAHLADAADGLDVLALKLREITEEFLHETLSLSSVELYTKRIDRVADQLDDRAARLRRACLSLAPVEETEGAAALRDSSAAASDRWAPALANVIEDLLACETSGEAEVARHAASAAVRAFRTTIENGREA